MWCCKSSCEDTALAAYARSLQNKEDDQTSAMLLPMYTVPVKDLLLMGEIEPHEELKAKGILVVFDKSMGNAAFISHQWVGNNHPDPEFKQMQVLQAALRHIMSDLKHIPLDVVTEMVLPGSKDLPTSKLVEKELFIWYDYFSCPQMESANKGSRSDLSKAIESIPAYVASCAFFFVLCPVIENENLQKIFSPRSWARRGWCRLERACCELGQNQSWIVVKAPTSLELLGKNLAFLKH